MRQRIEIRDGREYVVTTLPPDKRSTPAETRKRTLFQALSPGQKEAHIRQRIAKAKKRKRAQKRRRMRKR